MNGMCFPYALKRVLEDDALILVHGLYVGKNGVAAHAWVEKDGSVWDWQTHCGPWSTDYCDQVDEDGQHPDDCPCEPCPCLTSFRAGDRRYSWYDRNVAIAQTKFTQDGVMRKIISTGHYGPWVEPCGNCGADFGMDMGGGCLECGECL